MNNKKIHNSFEEDIILNSLGLLDEKEKELHKVKLSKSTDQEKKIASEFNNVASLIPQVLKLSINNSSPSNNVKEKLFEKINKKENSRSDIREKEFEFLYSDSDDWIQHPIDGIKVKQLAVNKEKDYVMLLMKVAAGTQYPPHHHSGAEECYVIEGDMYAEGRILGPGDFHHAEGGSDHEPLHTKNGCTLLLVIDPKDY